MANRISTVRSASIRGFEELVSELGGNRGDLLVEAGLAHDILVDEDKLFRLTTFPSQGARITLVCALLLE